MQVFVLDHEMAIRAGAFITMLVLMALAEILSPRRRGIDRRRRWPTNLAMVVFGTVLIRLLVPLMAVEAALWAQSSGFGLFNLLDWPVWLVMVLSVLLLDLAVYAQHVAFHHVPALWQLHRMHHSDLSLDVTSGVRFHPLEFVLSMLIKVAMVAALGIPAVAVIVFEVILNVMSLFNHGNLRLPEGLDRFLRRFLVTPAFHFVHHSTRRSDHNRNYGFNLTWWDYLFGTYKARPDKGIEKMDVGLESWRAPEKLGAGALLIMPWRPDPPVKKAIADGSS